MRGPTEQFRKPDNNEGGMLLFPRRKDNVQLLPGSTPGPRYTTDRFKEESGNGK